MNIRELGKGYITKEEYGNMEYLEMFTFDFFPPHRFLDLYFLRQYSLRRQQY